MFKVGDRVILADRPVNRDNDITRPMIGVLGTVVGVANRYDDLDVDFDQPIPDYQNNRARGWYADRFEVCNEGPW